MIFDHINIIVTILVPGKIMDNRCMIYTFIFVLLQITMWDLTNGKLLRTITDAHPPGSAVLHVKVDE